MVTTVLAVAFAYQYGDQEGIRLAQANAFAAAMMAVAFPTIKYHREHILMICGLVVFAAATWYFAILGEGLPKTVATYYVWAGVIMTPCWACWYAFTETGRTARAMVEDR